MRRPAPTHFNYRTANAFGLFRIAVTTRLGLLMDIVTTRQTILNVTTMVVIVAYRRDQIGKNIARNANAKTFNLGSFSLKKNKHKL